MNTQGARGAIMTFLTMLGLGMGGGQNAGAGTAGPAGATSGEDNPLFSGVRVQGLDGKPAL
jgi:hypothetical protein